MDLLPARASLGPLPPSPALYLIASILNLGLERLSLRRQEGMARGRSELGAKDTRPAAPSSGEMPQQGSSRSLFPAFTKTPQKGGYSFSHPVAKATWLDRQKSSRFQEKQPHLKQLCSPCPEERGLGALPSAPTSHPVPFGMEHAPPFKTHPL